MLVNAPSGSGAPKEGPSAVGSAPPAYTTRAEALNRALLKCRGKTGISGDHLEKIHEVAHQFSNIIILRPYATHNSPLLAAGHPTKNIDIKGKTADWGPHYGFIPKDQRFSKIAQRNSVAALSASAHVVNCIENHKADAINLSISDERIKYLVEQGIVIKNGSGTRFTLECSRANPAEKYLFQVEESKEYPGNFNIFHDDQPLQVLAPHQPPSAFNHVEQGHRLPYTADYDLFAVLPRFEDFGGQHVRRDSNESQHSLRRERAMSASDTNRNPHGLSVSARRASFSNASALDQNEKTGDITTQHEIKVRDALNQKLRPGQYSDFQLIQHGSDQGNPAPDDEENFPLTVVFPKIVGDFEMIEVLDPKRLNELSKVAIDAGYQFDLNNKWASPGLASTSIVGRSVDRFERLSDPHIRDRNNFEGVPTRARTQSDTQRFVDSNEAVEFNLDIFSSAGSTSARSSFAPPNSAMGRRGSNPDNTRAPSAYRPALLRRNSSLAPNLLPVSELSVETPPEV